MKFQKNIILHALLIGILCCVVNLGSKLKTNKESISVECKKRFSNDCYPRTFTLGLNNEASTKEERQKIICSRLEQSSSLDINMINCSLDRSRIYFRLHKKTLLSQSFNIEWLAISINPFVTLDFSFRFIKGFDINSYPKNIIREVAEEAFFRFVFSKLEFYQNDQVIRSCEDLKAREVRSIFQAFRPQFVSYAFIRSNFASYPICPLLFANVSFNHFIIMDSLVDTYFKTNLLRFTTSGKNLTISNAFIFMLTVLKFDKIKIDEHFLNYQVFKYLTKLILVGEIVSIQVGLFKSFRFLKQLVIHGLFYPKLVRSGGIDWIRDINADVRVNLSDMDQSEDDLDGNVFNIYISTISPWNSVSYSYSSVRTSAVFPDEDFCLYVNFPFDQAIIVQYDRPLANMDRTCSFAWLIQYTQIYVEYLSAFTIRKLQIKNHFEAYLKNLTQKIESCRFEKRLSLCNQSKFKSLIRHTTTYFDSSEKWLTVQFVFLIFFPVVCVLGIVANSLIVHVVGHKRNQKELDKNHYKYLKLHAVINIGILVIEPMSLIVECRGFITGFICSPARFPLFFQYFHMIFLMYISNALRLLTNSVYIGFAINRLSLVGNQNGKFVTTVSKYTIWQFLIRVIIPCLALPVVKIFNSLPNSYDFLAEYPLSPINFYMRISDPLIYAFLSFEFFFNFLNYVGFIFFNLIIDILLIVRLKRTLDEKKSKKIAIQQTSESNKEDPLKKTIKMVVLNSTFGIILRVLNIFPVIWDTKALLSVIDYSKKSDYLGRTFLTLLKTCSIVESCETIQLIANIFYLLSLSGNFLFFYRFDNQFKKSFRRVYFDEK